MNALSRSAARPVSAGPAVLALGVALALAAALAPVPAGAQTSLLWSFSGLENVQSIVATPDIDGDGGPDVCFDTYDFGPSGVPHLFAVRGASSGEASALWSALPTGGASNGGGYGDNCLRLGEDYNGDGERDLLFATAYGCRTAFALDRLTGSTLWSFDTYANYGSEQAGWIYAMDDLGSDLTADGVPEVVFCSGSYNDRVHCVDGATGAQRWVYYAQDACTDVRSCQDLNADGVRDVVVARGDDAVPEQVTALNGATGAHIWSRQIGNAIWSLAFITDITGDGIQEIVPGSWAGTLYCLNGATGAVVWSVATPGQQRVVALHDVNGDGVQDVAVGYNTTSQCRAFSGANGALLWNRAFTDWTWAIDPVADVTGDGINDVAVGDFDGKVTVLDGVSGEVFWSWLNPTGDKIMTIRGVPDLNGNGAPDVVAGTQMLSDGDGGDVYALEGNVNPTAAPGLPPLAGLRLAEAAPNPVRGATVWQLSAGTAGVARLLLFGPDGRQVRDLGERALGAGEAAALRWDGRDQSGLPVPAGVYHARLLFDGRPAAERKAVVLR